MKESRISPVIISGILHQDEEGTFSCNADSLFLMSLKCDRFWPQWAFLSLLDFSFEMTAAMCTMAFKQLLDPPK